MRQRMFYWTVLFLLLTPLSIAQTEPTDHGVLAGRPFKARFLGQVGFRRSLCLINTPIGDVEPTNYRFMLENDGTGILEMYQGGSSAFSIPINYEYIYNNEHTFYSLVTDADGVIRRIPIRVFGAYYRLTNGGGAIILQPCLFGKDEVTGIMYFNLDDLEKETVSNIWFMTLEWETP